jgi:hypothetical protein
MKIKENHRTENIGGFFELEHIHSDLRSISNRSIFQDWTENRPYQLFSSARSAIAYIREKLGSKYIWVPEVFCESLSTFNSIRIYPLIPKTFDPDIEFIKANSCRGDTVIILDFFGKEPGTYIQEQLKQERNFIVIEDASQNLLPKFTWADYVVFSPRKLLGVIDGGLIVENTNAQWKIELGEVRPTVPFIRTGFAAIKRRLLDSDCNLDSTYEIYKREESKIVADDKSMSNLSDWILKSLPTFNLIEKRRRNFRILFEKIGKYVPQEFLIDLDLTDLVPYALPIYIENRDKVQRALSENKIYCPVHWRISPLGRVSKRAQIHSQGQLSIPCDHRYGPNHMLRIVDKIQEITSNY